MFGVELVELGRVDALSVCGVTQTICVSGCVCFNKECCEGWWTCSASNRAIEIYSVIYHQAVYHCT